MLNFFTTYINNHHLVERIKNSPKFYDLFKNSYWSILGAIFSKGLIFISWILVARILGSEGYGQFGIIRSTILMFSTFAGFSLGITASKHVAEFADDDRERAGKILGLTMTFGILMGLTIGIVFYLLSPWLASETLNAPEIVGELKIASLILFFSSLNGAQIGGLEGFLAFKKIAQINVIHGVLSFPLFIVGALYFGVNGTVWAFTLSYVLICFLSQFAIRRESINKNIRVNFIEAWEERKLLFTYSLPAFLSGLMVSPIKWIADALLVSNSGFSEMGIFAAAFTFNSIIMVGAGMLKAPFITIMAKSKNDSKNSKFSKFNILAPWALGIYISLPFLVFPEIGGMIFGAEFQGKRFELTFVFILLFTIILMFKQGLSRLIIVYNLQWWGFLSNLIWGIILIGCFYYLPNKSSLSLSISYFVAYLINTLVIMPIYFKKNLIPNRTIASTEAFCIWGIVIITSVFGVYTENIVIKIIFLIAALRTMLFLFAKIVNKDN